MTDSRKPPGNGSNEDIERVLTEALHTGPPDAATLQRLREIASREWRVSVNRPPARAPRHRIWAAAAVLVCVIAGMAWFLRPVTSSEPFGVVVRTEAGSGKNAPVVLHVGQTLESRDAALIALSAGGTLRVAQDTGLTLISRTGIVLQHGTIYLDFPPTARSGAFDVSTRAGTIAHVGTAFEVLSNDEIVRIRVREGRVRLRHGSQETVLDAGTQLTADRAGNITRGSVPSYGREWSWLAALTPDFEIEGRPLIEFLQWAARELGREVKFADSHAQEVAERTILHGSVKGREPMDALNSVLLTTSLTYEVRGDTIWIQSRQGG